MSLHEAKLIRRENRLRLAAVLSIIILCMVVVTFVSNMLVSFVLAFVIAYLFNPWVTYFERRGYDRTLVTLLLFVSIGGITTCLIFMFAPGISAQVEQLEKSIPKYTDGFNDLVHNIESKIQDRFGSMFEFPMTGRGIDYLKQSASNLLAALPGLAGQILTISLLAPLLAFFMLRDGRTVSRQFLSLVPNNLFELSLNLLHQINEQMGGFIRARLLESAIVGSIVWVGLMWIDFPYALFLAVFAGVTNLIPYIGPFIGAIPAFLITFINKDPTATVVGVGITFLIAQLIDTVFIIPVVVAKIVDLHPVTVIVVMIIGAQVMGVMGMLISIPVASILKLCSTAIYKHLISFRV